EKNITDWSKLAQLQLTLDLNTMKTIIPNQLFTKESNELLKEICSRFNIEISPALDHLSLEES
ncbi:unnamed protein product, partial [Trichobilharzia szidati]